MKQEVQIVIIFIQNSKGEWFVNKRLASKRLYPNLYGVGAGGKVDFGEEVDAAARRELKEETGIDMEPQLIGTFDYKDNVVSHRINLFNLSIDCDIRNYSKEWELSGWISGAELLKLIDQNLVCPDTVKALEFFNNWNARKTV